MKRWQKLAAFLVIGALLASIGCITSKPLNEAQGNALERAKDRKNYDLRNDIEGRNYNWREELADDPTTILWCTSAFPIPSSPLFTIPIAGKLTSGNKRPYPTSQYINDNSFNPELPGPDGFYGQSSEYRYGFGPAGKAEYSDFYNMPTYCTTVPRIWQRETTTIVMAEDPVLLEAQNRAKQALAQGRSEDAQRILGEAVNKIQGGR